MKSLKTRGIPDHPSQVYKNYLGNPQLKAENVKVNFTQEQVDEFMKCKSDFVYFIKNYIKIINVDQGLIDFNLYDFQEDILKTVHNNRFSILKLPRQVGKCVCINTNVKIRNKKTGEIIETTVGELYEKVSKNKKV
jgi:hypothetical protein